MSGRELKIIASAFLISLVLNGLGCAGKTNTTPFAMPKTPPPNPTNKVFSTSVPEQVGEQR
jgi:hypothetical protein